MSWQQQPCLFPNLDEHLNSSTHNSWQSVEVPIRNTVNLDELCKKHEISPLTLLKVAWALVLRCYTGSSSPSYGHLTSKPQNGSNSESSYDHGSHIHGCSVELDGTYSIIEVLHAVEATFMENGNSSSYHSPVSCKKIDDSTLYNTVLQFQEIEHVGSSVSVFTSSTVSTQKWNHAEILFDIKFDSRDATIYAYLQNLGTRISTAAATNVAHTCAKAVDYILNDPFQLIDNLDLITKRDLEQLRGWELGYPERKDICVHDLFLKQVEFAPDSPAVCSWDGNLTYDELEKVTSLLACHFADQGVGPEILVPVCFEKSVYAILTMLAILRAGGAFVPLDPSHPKERLEAIIKKANAKLIVSSPKNLHIFRGISKPTISVSADLLGTLKVTLQDYPSIKVKTYNAAFVLFTSGSTGTPKGIVQEHRAVSTSSLAHGKALNMNSKSRVFQYAAYTFDVSMMDIFTTLMFGGCICSPSEEDRQSDIIGFMNRTQVNWVLFTPSVASLISPEDVPCLKTLVLGGEAITQENIARWAHAVRLYNCFGPAECGPTTTTYLDTNTRSAYIGRPFGWILCWVVDPENHNHLSPIGAVGELLVEGPTLARGYIDDIDKTRSVFIKDPQWPSEIAGTRTRRFYKTGDLVRYNSDGTMDFIGRKDFQVKIRGQRVELGEVEHHLSTHPDIALSMAASPKTGSYAKSLVAVIQVRGGDMRPALASKMLSLVDNNQIIAAGFSLVDVTNFLKAKLPKYMVPTHWFVVERIPLAVSGKIDRKLVELWLSQLSRDSASSIPTNGAAGPRLSKEDTIGFKISTKLISLVYRNDAKAASKLIGQDVTLDALGLDSIQMISLIMFIKKEFGVNLHISMLLDPNATISSITQCIEELKVMGSGHGGAKAVDIMTEFQKYKQQMSGKHWRRGPHIQNVLLTGATGYLGLPILFQLCTRRDIDKIMVLVRASNSNEGLQRIKKSAIIAGWWSDSYLERIEVWTGDLGQHRLGLLSDQWNCLTGNAAPSRRIHGIIHCGAKVHWNSAFSSLKPANVESTWTLLNIVNETPSILKFVYVSGGYNGPSEKHLLGNGCVKELPTGYAQTKLLSQLLVQEFSQTSIQNQSRVSIVKPSYIIGTVEQGVANVDDYIWRVVASCLQIGYFNETDADCWLFISDVDHVARTVSNCCDTRLSDPSEAVVGIVDGLSVRDFWSILRRDFGYAIEPLNQEKWLKHIQADIDSKNEVHPLWPLMDSLEKEHGKIGMPLNGTPQELNIETTSTRVEAAIRRNIEYLLGIGFLPKSGECIKHLNGGMES